MREYLYTIAISGILAYLITPVVRSLALKSGAYMHLRTRDMHKEITPRWGGIAMWTAMAASFFIVSHLPLVGKSLGREASGIFLAGTFIMLLGTLDDLYDLDSITKFAGQAFAGGILLMHGVQILWLPINGIYLLPPSIGQVLTIFFVMVVINAVNFVDGLDGLAIMPTVMVAGALAIFAYLTGNIKFAEYLHIPYVAGSGELIVICCSIIGAGLGFLWFNAYPAEVFMGDVGALALGAVLGVIAVIVRQEIVLFIMGGVFVMETVSVMLQVGSFKLRGKRIFRMAPIHHHYELKGWPETKVVIRFWIISFMLVLLGLTTLKIR